MKFIKQNITNKTLYTKHFYAESQRLASKLGAGLASSLVDPTQFQVTEVCSSYEEKSDSLLHMLERGWSCSGIEPGNVSIENPELQVINELAEVSADEPESDIYFYHSDHLGSSSWITDASGAVNQHLQYLPFGEDYIYQRTNSWNIPYTFSGKEKDAETGYSYFGARYYDSDLSVWLSVDPMSDKHPNFTPYAYVYQNPMNLVDHWGEDSIQLNRDGTTNVLAKTDDKFDVFVASDKNGNLDRSKTHILYDKDVRDKRTDTQSYSEKNDETDEIETNTASIDFYEIDNYEKAKEFFEFAAQNTDVEWSHNIVGSSRRSIVTTSHMERTEASGLYLVSHSYYIVDRRHSHPNYPNPSSHDRNNVPAYQKRPPYSLRFYIYHKGNYFGYSSDWADELPVIPHSY